jgi:hypothetical protein
MDVRASVQTGGPSKVKVPGDWIGLTAEVGAGETPLAGSARPGHGLATVVAAHGHHCRKVGESQADPARGVPPAVDPGLWPRVGSLKENGPVCSRLSLGPRRERSEGVSCPLAAAGICSYTMQGLVPTVSLSLELRSAHLARPFHEPSDRRSPARH